MNLAGILKETKSNAVYGGVTPALVEKATGAVKVVEVVFVGLTAPEVHVCDLKVAPEVACRVAVRLAVMLRALLLVCEPVERVVGMLVLGVLSQELFSLGPQGRDRLRRIVEVDGEAVSLVVVLHKAEDVVVDVAEEVHLGLHSPIILHVLQGGVFVEETAVPSAHLMV